MKTCRDFLIALSHVCSRLRAVALAYQGLGGADLNDRLRLAYELVKDRELLVLELELLRVTATILVKLLPATSNDPWGIGAIPAAVEKVGFALRFGLLNADDLFKARTELLGLDSIARGFEQDLEREDAAQPWLVDPRPPSVIQALAAKMTSPGDIEVLPHDHAGQACSKMRWKTQRGLTFLQQIERGAI